MQLPFSQVDVFSTGPLPGNPVAVVHDADGLTSEQMQIFANWTNLSETTFLCAPIDLQADYRLRIFTPAAELPFAGHPTLGSAFAWLRNGGTPRGPDVIRQECGAGLIDIKQSGHELAFAAPPLTRSGPVEAALLSQLAHGLGIEVDHIVDSNWIDNGPGWIGLRLATVDEVLRLRPDAARLGAVAVGVIAPHTPGAEVDFEVRAFAPLHNVAEDPVTGSLNAGFAQWLMNTGSAGATYKVAQGTAVGRTGRLTISRDETGTVWVGGASRVVVSGTVTF